MVFDLPSRTYENNGAGYSGEGHTCLAEWYARASIRMVVIIKPTDVRQGIFEPPRGDIVITPKFTVQTAAFRRRCGLCPPYVYI